jgi:hypothetical protein
MLLNNSKSEYLRSRVKKPFILGEELNQGSDADLKNDLSVTSHKSADAINADAKSQ